MKDERVHHLDNETDMRKEKGAQKEEYGRDEMQNIGEVEDREKELDQILRDTQHQLDLSKKTLIQTYE